MANPEHLEILKQGVEAWNRWRDEHPEIKPDLSSSNLRSNELTEANLSNADLSNADLVKAKIIRANLQGVNLHSAHLYEAMLGGSDLSNSDLSNAHCSSIHLTLVKLSRATLTGGDFDYADLSSADLSNADLSNASLISADLSNTKLGRAKLNNTDLRSAYCDATDLSNTDLRYANLIETKFFRANLYGANLSSAKLGGTIFVNIDLRIPYGLETVEHTGPSTIDIDTIIASDGNIPEIFLKGAGVDDTFITYIRSLVGKPIEYYSCFISYSSKDDAFAKRMYADLQSHNVRCWFAPEDLKIGDRIRPRIDESIRLHDKLLLVLSEHSVASKWVEFEVEAAMDKEREGKPPVLFPVRLDRSVMDSTTAWAKHIKRTRNIGDFSGWKDHDEYQKAFERLLRDLKAPS